MFNFVVGLELYFEQVMSRRRLSIPFDVNKCGVYELERKIMRYTDRKPLNVLRHGRRVFSSTNEWFINIARDKIGTHLHLQWWFVCDHAWEPPIYYGSLCVCSNATEINESELSMSRICCQFIHTHTNKKKNHL